MKERCKAQPGGEADQLAEVNENILTELQRLIRLVEADAHPDRIEQEYAYMRYLLSRRRDCFFRKRRVDGRWPQCTG